MTSQGQVQTMEPALDPPIDGQSATSSNISPSNTSKPNFDLDYKDDSCPFSFQKRPIKSFPNDAVMSEMIPANDTLTSSNPFGGSSSHTQVITRKSSSLTSGLSNHGYSSRNQHSKDQTTPPNPNLYNHINYDEQIRAPRMSNINYYTYSSKDKDKQSDFLNKKSSTSSTTSTDNDKDSNTSSDSVNIHMDQANNDTAATSASSSNDKQYLPAKFDLSQPTRRFSTPSNPEDTDNSLTTILSYTTNNYIYERNNNKPKSKFKPPLPQIPQHNEPSTSPSSSQTSSSSSTTSSSHSSNEQEKLLKAIDNLNKNTTTQEKQMINFNVNQLGNDGAVPSHRIKNRTSNFIPNHLSDNINGTSLQQVYELKKPLIVPAVLRPITSADSNDTIVPPAIDNFTATPTGTPPKRPLLNRNSSSEMGDCLTSPNCVQMKPFPYQFPPQLDSTSSNPASNNFMSALTDIFSPVEPTHKHWKPNSFTDHCMKCFDTFGNFFIPQRKRRHHCRFCGLIFCMNCLYKNPEMYGDFEATTSTTDNTIRSIMSNSSLNSNNGHNGGNSGGDEYISGVMMDQNGRLVIPIFKNLIKLNSEPSLVKTFKKLFKFCKICKDCGNNYLNLMQNMNTNEDFNSPFIFVENVYIKRMEEEERMSVDFTPDKPGFKDTEISERQTSITQVPSDWTWSSF